MYQEGYMFYNIYMNYIVCVFFGLLWRRQLFIKACMLSCAINVTPQGANVSDLFRGSKICSKSITST